MSLSRHLCVFAMLSMLISVASPTYGQVSSFLQDQLIDWQVPLSTGVEPEQFSEVRGSLVFTSGSYRERDVYRTFGATVEVLGNISGATSFATAQDKVYYYDDSALSDSTLYSTDGTTLDTITVSPLGIWDYDLVLPTQTQTLGDELIYRAEGPNGWDLFRTDGKTIESFGFAATSLADPYIVDVLDSQIVVTVEAEMFAIDGQQVSPILHEGKPLFGGRFVEFGGELFFSGSQQGSLSQLFKTDGNSVTSLGTFKMYDDYLVTEDELFFWGHPVAASSRKRVLSTDGTNITDYGFEMLNGNFARFLTTFNGEVYFRGWGSGEGTGLYRTDGESNKRIMPLSQYGAPRNGSLIEYNGELYFPANSTLALGRLGLFKTDGEEAVYIDTKEGPVERRPLPIGVLGDSLFLSAEGPFGYELLKIRGDTLEWFDLNPDGNSRPDLVAEFNDKLFISADGPGGPIFVTDGESLTGIGNVTLWNGEDALYLVDHNGTRPTLYKLPSTGVVSADFNGDSQIDVADIDELYSRIDAGSNDVSFDLNGDGSINTSDVTVWLAAASEVRGFSAPIRRGDANLDGVVNSTDLNVIGRHWQRADATSWSQGDFNNDGHVDATDLNFVGKRWRTDVTGSAIPAAVVPEPASVFMTLCCLCGLAGLRSRHNFSKVRNTGG